MPRVPELGVGRNYNLVPEIGNLPRETIRLLAELAKLLDVHIVDDRQGPFTRSYCRSRSSRVRYPPRWIRMLPTVMRLTKRREMRRRVSSGGLSLGGRGSRLNARRTNSRNLANRIVSPPVPRGTETRWRVPAEGRYCTKPAISWDMTEQASSVKPYLLRVVALSQVYFADAKLLEPAFVLRLGAGTGPVAHQRLCDLLGRSVWVAL